MKKVVFQHKPFAYAYGQYNFSEDSTQPFEIENSTGVPERYDKFSDKDLYSLYYDNEINKAIIDGNLQYEAESYVSIEKCDIRNSGVNSKVQDIDTRVFICDNFHDKFTSKTPDLMNFTELDNALFSGDNSLNKNSMIYESLNENRGRGKHVGNILENQVIFTKLHNVNSNNDLEVEFKEFDNSTADNFDASKAFKGEDTDSDGQSDEGIFNFSQGQEIYIIIFTSGDMDRKWWQGGDRARKHRIHVFSINTATEFTSGGEIRNFSFNYSDAVNVRTGPSGKAAAFVVDSLKFTINSKKSYTDVDYTPPSEYLEFTGSLQPPKRAYIGLDFNTDFLSFSPNAQLESTDRYDYTPIPNINLIGENFNLQNYFIDENDKLIASAPNQISLDFSISLQTEMEGLELNTESNPNLNHLFYVISWDDPTDKLKDWEAVLQDIPTDEVELIRKREQNLYVPAKVTTDSIASFDSKNKAELYLKHNYNAPGLKTIRTLMFSYYYNESLQYIEPIRWKLITSRIFLDIPINQYPDFAEVGGSEYTTIPWPYTTPIIGGVDNNSKYKISVQNTLSSGKIGNTDIIDERFLVNDLENDETGKSILTFDLEQVRYFNTGSYDMHTLLKIPIDNDGYYKSTYNNKVIEEDRARPVETFYNPTVTLETDQQTDSSPEYLATLPFPQYIKEFDLSGNGEVDLDDASLWPQELSPSAGRPDISDLLYFLAAGSEPPANYTYPDYVYEWKDFSSIPSSIFYDNYWNGSVPERTFSEESSVGQIFITDNSDVDLKQNCHLEINTGQIIGSSIYDSSGNSNKGLLIGDYKVKKNRKGEPMRRDSFIKLPKRTGNTEGAL